MDHGTARRRLEEQRRRIEQGLKDLSAPSWDDDLGEVTEEGIGSTGTAEIALRERLQSELRMLERAERRLHEGTYGLSVDSGRPIPEERLHAYPLAERTVEEQRELDLRVRIYGSQSTSESSIEAALRGDSSTADSLIAD